jgi:hypothetical protein
MSEMPVARGLKEVEYRNEEKMFEDAQEQETWILSDSQDHEFIPLISSEDEEAMQKEEVPEVLPLLSLRNTVLFPGVVIPITVGRDRSIRLIKEAHQNEQRIGVVSQKNDDIEIPVGTDLNEVGTVAKVVKSASNGLTSFRKSLT